MRASLAAVGIFLLERPQGEFVGRDLEPPVRRPAGAPRPAAAASGTQNQSDGLHSYDLNAEWAAKPKLNPGPGAVVQAQFWYRDPFSGKKPYTSISDAIDVTVSP